MFDHTEKKITWIIWSKERVFLLKTLSKTETLRKLQSNIWKHCTFFVPTVKVFGRNVITRQSVSNFTLFLSTTSSTGLPNVSTYIVGYSRLGSFLDSASHWLSRSNWNFQLVSWTCLFSGKKSADKTVVQSLVETFLVHKNKPKHVVFCQTVTDSH